MLADVAARFGHAARAGVLARLGTLRFTQLADTKSAQIAIFPDGKRIASAGSSFVPMLKPGATVAVIELCPSVRLWDRATGKLLREILFAKYSALSDLKFSPDNRHLAINHNAEEIIVVELNSEQKSTYRTLAKTYLCEIHFSPDGESIIDCTDTGQIHTWQLKTPKQAPKIWNPPPLPALQRNDDPIHQLCSFAILSPDQKLLAHGRDDESVKGQLVQPG